jgi:Mg2+ and Co2+ transporter CorA
MEVIIVAVVGVLGASVIGPGVAFVLAQRTRQAERAEDKADRAEVADQARQAAVLVQEVAATVKTTTTTNAATLERIETTGQQTHLLVNSNMMKEMRKGLVSDRGQLLLLQRVIALTKQAGSPSDDDEAYVKVLQAEIVNAEQSLKELEDRTAAAAKVADAQPALPA